MTIQDVAVDVGAFAEEWRRWHSAHEARVGDPHGFLAVTSLHWLQDAPERFADAPGEWSTGPDGVRVVLGEGELLVVGGGDGGRGGRDGGGGGGGVAVRGEYAFGVIGERDSVFAGFGDAVIEVAKRGGHDILRPRYPDHPLRVAYRGTPAFEPDPRWAVPGRYVPFDTPRPTTVGAAVEGLLHVYDAPGRVEFELDGRPLSLTVFPGHAPGELMALFTDGTSGVTTYAANRSLRIGAPDADGVVWLDFNRAVNLPCAYTDLATCPLPPTENRLPVAIEAGEKTPRERG
jgi:uncharacterized protein